MRKSNSCLAISNSIFVIIVSIEDTSILIVSPTLFTRAMSFPTKDPLEIVVSATTLKGILVT